MKKIILLGSTGSIGLNTLEIVREHPEYELVGLVARASERELLAQAKEFRPKAVCLTEPHAQSHFKKSLPKGTKFYGGLNGARDLVRAHKADILMAASSGTSALLPVLDAIECGQDIAIANKEILVIAGREITQAAHKKGVRILPVDSEHSAIFQCIQGAPEKDVRQILLTGSGGPLKDTPEELFRGISTEVVINHPKWNMGKKISVDSATMMNKGLEIIEAQWLFGVPLSKIKVLVHPQAIVHSMVEFVDGSILAQMGPTDMRSPILTALSWPRRITVPHFGVDLTAVGELTFSDPQHEKFPCLALAQKAALDPDSTLPVVLSAADEVAVHAFLNQRIDFTDIPVVIRNCMNKHQKQSRPSLKQILAADAWARQTAEVLCLQHDLAPVAKG